jgi:hypothetical protein
MTYGPDDSQSDESQYTRNVEVVALAGKVAALNYGDNILAIPFAVGPGAGFCWLRLGRRDGPYLFLARTF